MTTIVVRPQHGYRRMYAGGLYESPPGWMKHLAKAATGVEMLENTALRTLTPAAHEQIRQLLLEELRKAAESGDEVAESLHKHFAVRRIADVDFKRMCLAARFTNRGGRVRCVLEHQVGSDDSRS